MRWAWKENDLHERRNFSAGVLAQMKEDIRVSARTKEEVPAGADLSQAQEGRKTACEICCEDHESPYFLVVNTDFNQETR